MSLTICLASRSDILSFRRALFHSEAPSTGSMAGCRFLAIGTVGFFPAFRTFVILGDLIYY
jgi:hypothetical protein